MAGALKTRYNIAPHRKYGTHQRGRIDMIAQPPVKPWTTFPLTPEERADFRRLFEQRLQKVEAKTAGAFAFKDVKEPPFIVNSAMYWISRNGPITTRSKRSTTISCPT
jgi:hypothetical protein